MSNLNSDNDKYYKHLFNFWETHSFSRNLSYSDKINAHILNATIDYIRLAKGFDKPLFWIMNFFSFFIYILINLPIWGYKFHHIFFQITLKFYFILL